MILQLSPVGDQPSYSCEGMTHGYVLYSLFTTVVILNQAVQQTGTSSDIVQFRERLRGQSTEAGWVTLLQHSPQSASGSNLDDFENAIHLFCKNNGVAEMDMKSITKLGPPIACISACTKASLVKSDEAGRLKPTAYLAKNAKVMLTANLWQ